MQCVYGGCTCTCTVLVNEMDVMYRCVPDVAWVYSVCTWSSVGVIVCTWCSVGRSSLCVFCTFWNLNVSNFSFRFRSTFASSLEISLKHELIQSNILNNCLGRSRLITIVHSSNTSIIQTAVMLRKLYTVLHVFQVIYFYFYRSLHFAL